ncbi:Mediator-associated protein 1 [Striga hermonthica]|uniref:Mediator-associated protein 1 n=1 Tax=Striga hermonthica TaxID=68872 RepID=A0A9N7R167_STRHE|nr:Mediator-associated protein 1 [Striga hermonthica]
MSKARQPEKPVFSETSSYDHSSSEEIESEPEPIRKSSAPPAAAKKPETRSAQPAESHKMSRKKSKAKGKEVKGKGPTVAKKSKNSKKAEPQTPVASKPAPPDEDSGSESESEKNSRKESKRKGKDKTRKRALDAEGTVPTVTKNLKTSKKAEPEASEKKVLFQRIWSESDEIALLNGILQFRAENKCDPYDNMDAFRAYIKKNLHFDVRRNQLRDKMSRMKKKYTTNKRKEQEGKGRRFTSQHEQEAYDLSDKVWGADKENATGSGPEKEKGVEKGNGSEAKKEMGVEKGNNIKDLVASERRFVRMKEMLFSGLGENVLAVGDLKLEEEEMGVKEDKEAWKKLHNEAMEVDVKHFELKTQQSKLLVQIMKSRGY